MEDKMNMLKQVLSEAERFAHAARVVEFDQMTVCPKEGRAGAADVVVALRSLVYQMKHDTSFMDLVEELYAESDALDEWDRTLLEQLHTEFMHTKHISVEMKRENEQIRSKAWLDWNEAKEAADFSLFAESLDALLQSEKKRVQAWEANAEEAGWSAYERMFSENERGLSTKVLDELFAESKMRIGKLLERIRESGKQIRTDFLSRTVTEEQQKRLIEYLLTLLKFDKSCGTYSFSEHPFSEQMGQKDVRVTTHLYSDNFLSNMYSVLHECGHALFEQLQPVQCHTHFITSGKTMGMHESVSRFYENVIGRSRAFIHLVYPKLCEIFPEVFFDVSERELYEAVNVAVPSLIRVDADELTYTLHVAIRYEIEKELIDGNLSVKDVPACWNSKYKEYLGVVPENDREGVLQDSHWSSDFGYFPTYAMGNYYNAMYALRMKEDISLETVLESGDFATINAWMAEHVFQKADRLDVAEWMLDITGKPISADAFLCYLEAKYSDLYGL